MKMETTHYLPHEELKASNYPEIANLMPDIQIIQTYAMTADQAVFAFNEGLVNKIDIDVTDMRKAVDKCRYVCNIIGTAENVCYDLLMELRAMQTNFQELIFMKNRFGSEYIGTPTNTEDLSGGSV